MKETSTSHSDETRSDIATRWQKGQSGNLKGRPLGSGATPTSLARTMMERPVERSDGVGGTRTRLTEYMSDIVERADAGDLKCRTFLIRYVDRGDRRKLAARRNAKKAKTAELREFESAAADEISQTPMVPPEKAAEQVKTIPPASRVQTIAVSKRAPSVEASSFRRDPRTGELLGPDGSPLSREEEERLLYPNWPHISPHLKKDDAAGAGLNTGQKTEAKIEAKTGLETGLKTGIAHPVSPTQEVDSAQDFGSEKISQKKPASLDFLPPLAGEAARAQKRA